MAPITWLLGDSTIDVDPWTPAEPSAPVPIDPPVYTPPVYTAPVNPPPIAPPAAEPPAITMPSPIPGNHGVATARYYAATGELSITLGHNIGVVGFETGGLFDPTYQTPSNGRAPTQSDGNVVAYFDPTGLAVGEWSLGARLPAGLAPTPGLINFGYTPIGSPSVEAAIEWVLDDGSVFVEPYIEPAPSMPIDPWPQEGPWETPATPPVVGEPQEPILPSPDPIDPPTYTEDIPAITRPWWPGVIDPAVPSYPEGELVIDQDLKLWLINLIDVDFQLGGDFDGALRLRQFAASVMLTDVLTFDGASADSFGTNFLQLASASGHQSLATVTGRATANADDRTIPEPSAVALAAMATLGAMARRRP